MKNALILALPVFAALLVACRYPEEYNPLLGPRGKTVRGLEVIIPSARITEAGLVQAEAWLILSDGTKEPADTIAWESLTPEVVSVDGEGLVRGRAPGRGTIRALRGGMTATGELEVERRIDYGRILISEVFYDAAGSDEGKEFIELYNGNDYDCDLSGMEVADGSLSGSPFAIPGGSLVRAGGYLVIAASRDGFFSLFGAYPDLAGLSFTLNNGGETVRLMRGGGSVVDMVCIAGGSDDVPPAGWWCDAPLPAAAAGESVSRAAAGDTDTCRDWAAGPPTPGR